MSLKLIERIEFHEIKGRYRVKAIETRFYVKDIKEFLRWCTEGHGGYYEKHKFDGRMYDYYLKSVSGWKKRKQKFKIHIAGTYVFVYPQDRYVAVQVAGIHYICQHSFDIIPKGRDVFYGYDYNEFVIGKLYPLPRRGKEIEPMDVTNKDILDGFMIHREIIDSYKDDFVLFIYRRRKEGKNDRS